MPEAGSIEIVYTPTFLKSYARLSPAYQRRFDERETWFRANPFDQRLKTHALKGKLLHRWAFSVTPSIRVVFRFDGKNVVTMLRVGTHDQAYR